MAAHAPLTRRVLFAYGAPALPAAMLGLPLLVYLPTFYAQELGLGLAVVGAVILAARIWDVVTDPLVGFLSDRTRTRFGRRRPWLVASLPLVLCGVWFLFRPPADAGVMHLLAWIFVVYLGWTMMQIPHQAWGAELSDDYGERARITGTREAFGLAGVIIAAVLPATLPALGLADPARSVAAGLGAIALITVVALPITGAIMLFVVPEPPPSARPAPAFGAGLVLLKANGPFRRLLAAYFLNGIANGLPSTLFLLFVTHHLRLEAQQGVFLLVYFLAGLAGVPVALALARRVGKHRAWCLAMLVTCAAFIVAPLLPAGAMLGFTLICLVTGLGLGADLALPPAMQADVIDEDTAAGGAGRAGLYFALWGMATKLALALAVGTAFPLLDLAGFKAVGDNAGTAMAALAGLYAWVPIALKLVAIVLMWRFPLDAARQAALSRVIRSGSPGEQAPCGR